MKFIDRRSQRRCGMATVSSSEIPFQRTRGGSVGAFASDDGRNRLRQEFDIKLEAPVTDVIDVHLALNGKGEVGAAADLPDAGQAWSGVEAPARGQIVFGDLPGKSRARTDERHISAKDAPELGQFVEAEAAQNRTDAGDSRISLHLEGDRVAVLVEGTDGGNPLLGIDDHGAKLGEAEDPAMFADTLLPEEDRAVIVEFDQERDQGEDRRDAEQSCTGDQDIDGSLQGRSEPSANSPEELEEIGIKREAPES